MEVKILCSCGAKYKFDVEPLHGKLPGPVKCPVCQADGTDLGNQVLAQTLASAPAPAASAPTTSSIRIGVPQTVPPSAPSGSGFVAPAIARSSKDFQPSAPPPPPQSSPAPVILPGQPIPVANPLIPKPGGGTKLSVSAAHAVLTPVADTAEPVPAVSSNVPPSRSQKMEADPSFTRGLVGIGVASFLGLLLWFAITLFLGAKFKWMAVGIGAMIGWVGYKFAKEKSQPLGFAAAGATALVMIIGVLWSARHEAYQAVNETIDELWKVEVAYAKRAVEASRTDQQLWAFLVSEEEMLEEDEEGNSSDLRATPSDPGEIDPKALADFKKNELSKLRNLASGKTSKSQFDRENRPLLEELYTAGFIFARAFKIKVLILVGLAVGAAWKLTSGA